MRNERLHGVLKAVPVLHFVFMMLFPMAVAAQTMNQEICIARGGTPEFLPQNEFSCKGGGDDIGQYTIGNRTYLCCKPLEKSRALPDASTPVECGPEYVKDGKCCVKVTEKGDATGRGEVRSHECPGMPAYKTADCWCKIKDTVKFQGSLKTYQGCEMECKNLEGSMDTEQGVAKFGKSATVSSAHAQNRNALCFTTEECQEEGGTPAGNPEKQCPGQMVKCIAPEPEIELSSPILGQTKVKGLRTYIPLMFNYALSISVIVAAIMFIVAGFKYVAGATVDSIGQAKEDMVNAVVGLVLLFGATTLMQTINPNLGQLDRLTVYMVNKQQFALSAKCNVYKPETMFASLESRQVPPDPSTLPYTVPGTKTECGKFYLPKDFMNSCIGTVCPTPQQACVPCTFSLLGCKAAPSQVNPFLTNGPAKDSVDVKPESVCVKTMLSGTIRWKGSTAPTAVYLLAICNYAQGTDQVGVAGSVRIMAEVANPSGTSGQTNGEAFYSFAPPKTLKKDASDKCASAGGLRGFALGIRYRDACSVLGDAVKGAKDGMTNAVLGGLSCISAADDFTIVRSVDCGNTGSALFGAYLDGGAGSATANAARSATGPLRGSGILTYQYFGSGSGPSDEKYLGKAAWCGNITEPVFGKNKRSFSGSSNALPTFELNNLWKPEDMERILMEQEPTKVCDFTLSINNAPPDPGTNLMGGACATQAP